MTDQRDFTLANGALKFSAVSMGEGPVVILMHGFPDTLHSWQAQMERLATAGYCAVAVAMRGYEPQSQPADNDYSLDALATDVAAWIEQLGGAPVHLVGHDWGAAVAYAAGVAMPERLLSLTTMAVPHAGRLLTELHRHPRQLALSWYMLYFQLRGVSDYHVQRKDFAFLRRLWRDWSPGWAFSDADFEPVVEAFERPGVVTAALAYYRAALGLRALPLTPSARAAFRWPISVPTLALTGAQEGCIASDVFQDLMYGEDFPAGLNVVEVPDAGHFLHREQPDVVSALMIDWLGKHTPVRASP